MLNAIAVKANPRDPSIPVVNLLGTPTRAGHPSEARIAAGAIAALLRKARAEGHEAAGLVADLAGQLGVTEHVPKPEPAPPPAPAPDPVPGY